MRQQLLCFAIGISLLAQEPPPAADSKPCRIHGQLLDEGGLPVPGVELRINGWSASSERKKRFGVPADWVNPGPYLTDEKGRFDIRYVPPQAFQFTLTCTHPEWADLGWRWRQIELGEFKDLGKVPLERPGMIAGQIVDSEGVLLAEGWRVMANLESFAEHHRGVLTKHVSVDSELGQFRIQDLPAGRVQLTAMSLAGEKLEAVYVNTTAGEETWIELVHKGADVRDSILLEFTAHPFQIDGKWLAESEMRAIDARGKSWPITSDHTGWSASDLAPGQYTVRVDSPWFLPWRADKVKIGTKLRVHLVGRGALALWVLDPTGQSLAAYSVSLRPKGSTGVTVVRRADQEPPPSGLHGGLVPGEYELIIKAPGFLPYAQGDVRIQAEDPLDIAVRMEPVIPFDGRVLDAAGRPATGVLVQATPGAQAGHNGPWPSGMPVYSDVNGKLDAFELPRYQDEDTTDEDGYFRLKGVGQGPHTLRLFVSPWVRIDELVEVREGVGEATLRLPPLGSIKGRVLFDGARPDGNLTVDQASQVDGIHLVHIRASPFPGAKVDSEGRFQLGPLLCGLQEFVFKAETTTGNGAVKGARTAFRVDVAEGASTLYDLNLVPEQGPHRANLHLALGGRVFRDEILIHLIPLDEWDPLDRRRPPRSQQSTIGVCLFDGLPAGKYEVGAASRDWNWRFPEPLVLGPSSPSKVILDIPQPERTLHVVDAQGRPRPATQVWYGTYPNRLTGGPSTTDHQGHLQLALVPGTYCFSLQQAGNIKDTAGNSSVVIWEAGIAPLQLILE